MAINLLYTFPDLATSNTEFTVGGTQAATTISSAGTVPNWCWNNTTTASGSTGPSGGCAAVGGEPAGTTLSPTTNNGYIYTETSSPFVSGDSYTALVNTTIDCAANTNVKVGFWTNMSGAGIASTVDLMVNENGAGWVSVYHAGSAVMWDNTGAANFWYKHLVDLTTLGITGNSVQLRWDFVIINATTSYRADTGFDYIEITGDTAAVNRTSTSCSGTFSAIEGSAGGLYVPLKTVQLTLYDSLGNYLQQGIAVHVLQVSDGNLVGTGTIGVNGTINITVSTDQQVYVVTDPTDSKMNGETMCTPPITPV